MIWEEPVALGKAVKGTGIAAVSWDGASPTVRSIEDIQR